MTTPALFLFSPDLPQGVEAFHVELPLPPRGTGSNARGSWLWNKDAIKNYRHECMKAFVRANLPIFKMPITIHCELFYCRGNKDTHPQNYKWRPKLKRWDFKYQVCHDEGNARESIKPAIDALQDAGIVTRDSRRNIRLGYCTIRGTAKEHGGKTGLVMVIQGERASV